MEGVLAIAVVLIVLGLVLVIANAQRKAAEARAAAILRLAYDRKLEYVPGPMNDRVGGGFFEQLFGDPRSSEEGQFLARFQGYEPFGQGHSPEVKNLVYGRYGEFDWAIFDYTYRTTQSTGKSTTTTTHYWGVVVARVPVILPVIDMQPENILHRIGSKLGMDELTVELEEFNRRYFIRTTDKQAAYDVLHPKAIELLMSLPIRHWQIAGYQIMLSRRQFYEPAEIAALMYEIEEFAKLIPGYVREDHGIAPNWNGPF